MPSAEPHEIVEPATVRRLLDAGTFVICGGCGGTAVVRSQGGQLRGAEAVIDKVLNASLLARELEADSPVRLTDMPAVISGFGTEHARPLGRVTTTDLRAEQFPVGSMGPSVNNDYRFVEARDRIAKIGRLLEAADILAGHRGIEIVLG